MRFANQRYLQLIRVLIYPFSFVIFIIIFMTANSNWQKERAHLNNKTQSLEARLSNTSKEPETTLQIAQVKKDLTTVFCDRFGIMFSFSSNENWNFSTREVPYYVESYPGKYNSLFSLTIYNKDNLSLTLAENTQLDKVSPYEAYETIELSNGETLARLLTPFCQHGWCSISIFRINKPSEEWIKPALSQEITNVPYGISVTYNYPPGYNALNQDMLKTLDSIVSSIEQY